MRLIKPVYLFIFLCIGHLSIGTALALDVNIKRNLSHVNTAHNGEITSIQRIQNQDHVLTGGYTKTSRKCPPFCIQPMQIAGGVTTVAELELLDFIKTKLNHGTGVLIDARTPSWFNKSTIPGSINIPFTTFDKKSDKLVKTAALAKLGVTIKAETKEESFFDYVINMIKNKPMKEYSIWDFSKAKEVLLWCNGAWCGQSPRAIKGLLALGYPAEKIYYYRGGMQAWQSLGLTTK